MTKLLLGVPNITSPIDSEEEIKVEKVFNVSNINKRYIRQFKIDTSKYFQNIEKFYLLKGLKSNYRFFYPIATGDSFFYEHLQQFDWYYMPWKWEHAIAYKFIKSNDKILEIGCGKGSFLKKISETKTSDVVGLELNKSNNSNTFPILNESIEEFVMKNNSEYTIICAFQVLEHIPDISSFINNCIKAIKPKGKLILSVPNNDSFIKYSDNLLNMPPHHMGLWNKKSLKNLENYFPLKLKKIIYEPLQEYHKNWYYNIHEKRFAKIKQNKYYRKIVYKFPYFIQRQIERFFKKIYFLVVSKKGHTVLVVFLKK